MKKGILLLLAAVMILASGCGREAQPQETTMPATEPTTQPTETEAPTEYVPETAEGVILADQVPAVLMYKNRGDFVSVVGEYDEEHYAVKTDSGYGLVKKALARNKNQEPTQPWTGYARWNTEVFDSFYLSGDPLKKLGGNTKVEVLEDLGTCYLIKIEEIQGYAEKKQIGKYPSTGSGGGSSGDAGGSGGGSTGQDGGDITMEIQGEVVLLSFLEQNGDVTGEAVILADRTPIVLGYFSRGDRVPVIQDPAYETAQEGVWNLYWEGIYAYVEQPLLRMASAPAYTAWDGFLARGGKCWKTYHLSGEPMKNIPTNTPVHVLEDLGEVYLAQVRETLCYIAKDQVSETKVPVSSGNGGGSSGGSGGGGQEWSDPVL